MDVSHLSLKRVVISNFKSLKRIELDNLKSLALFMGRNNAGKSNILDSFKFVAEAAISFDHALSSRGGSLREVTFRKQADANIEFLFEFVLDPQTRAEVLARLFAGNQSITPNQAAASALLSKLTLKITLGQNQFSEELLAASVKEESRPVLIFSIKGSPKKIEALSGGLDSLCARCTGEFLAEPQPLAAPVDSGPYRLRLGLPEGAGKEPIACELAEMVRQQFAQLEWIDPLRRLPTRVPILGHLTVAPDASNLPDVLHWLYNNKPKQFRRIETEVAKLVPQLGRLYTPTMENAATLGLIDSQDEDLVFSMDQMSFGTRSLVAIVAKVILAKAGGWICVEEPETYLHPQAQMGLFQFLRDEATRKRIFVATHSTSIAASCPIHALFIVHRDEKNCTVAMPVAEAGVVEVIEQLGIKPSFSFEADAIVFVEDADDIPAYQIWAKKFGFRIKVQFIDVEGAATLHYFANARVALSKFVHTLVFAIFGGGPHQSEAARRTQQRIVEHLQLAPEQCLELDLPELSGCLLDAKAIVKACPALPLPEAQLEERLVVIRQQPEQKKDLQALFAEFKLGDYNSACAARIAEAMEAIPAKVLSLFKRIDTDAKPYWKV